MRSLIRTYGHPLSGVLVLLAGIWVVGLIVLPQLRTIETSLWWEEASPEQAGISSAIDRRYNELMLLRMDRDAAGPAERAAIERQIDAAEAEIRDLEARERAPVKVYGFANYARMSGLHFRIFLRTIAYAALVTLLALVVCYPVAWAVASAGAGARATLLLLGLVVPYAINELLRVYAWLMILDYQGVLNGLLGRLGLVDLAAGQWIPFLEHPGAVFAAMVYAYVLFMVFPISNTMETLERAQIEAARDLGASAWRIHRRIVIPHSRPGIAVGCIMTFMLSAGSYAVPQIMTRGTGGDWFTQLIYRQFFEANNWHIGAAYAFTLLLACITFILLVMAVFRVGLRDIAR